MSPELDTRIHSFALSLGADYYGVADLSLARDFICRQGGERVACYPIAVVIGMGLPDDIVDLLPDKDHEEAVLYRHISYDIVNQMLDQIAVRVANELQRAGYHAFPVPASKRTDERNICGIFSQKLAAHLAGLGWIGKNCLLVTPDHGPRVRWISVLTDAQLQPTGTEMESRCGECTACVDICPQKALTGRLFSPDESREARFDAAACDRYFSQMEKSGGVAVCGLCLFVCPYGRKRYTNNRKQTKK